MHASPTEINVTPDTQIKEALPEMQAKPMTIALVLLCFCVTLLMTGFAIIIPVFPRRLESLGLGVETLALMEGAFGFGMFLFSTPMGTLADRIGRKPIVLLALAGFIVTNIVLALVNSGPVFIIIRFLEGALVAGLMPAATAIVGDSVPFEKQGRWIGFITTAQATGFALGPGIGGFLYQAWGFSSPFFLSSAIALVASLLALIMLPETLPAHVREKAQLLRASRKNKEQGAKNVEGGAPSVASLLLLFAPFIFFDFGLTFIYPFVLPQYPFYFENVLKYDASQYGLIISAYGIALAIFPMILGPLTEKFSKQLLIVIGSILVASLNVAMIFWHQYPILIVSSLLTGLGSSLIMPAMGMIYLGATSDHNRSQVMGIRGTAISMGILAAPLAQAAIGPLIAPEITFGIGVAITAVMTLVAVFVFRTPKQTQETVAV